MKLLKYPNCLRAISPTRAAGIIVPYGVLDKYRNWWDGSSDFLLDMFRGRPLLHMHTLKGDVSRHGTMLDDSLESVGEGLFAEFETDDFANRMIGRGDQGYSTGAYPPSVRIRKSDGYVSQWPIVETSFGSVEKLVSLPGTTTAFVRSLYPGVDFPESIERGVWMATDEQNLQGETTTQEEGASGQDAGGGQVTSGAETVQVNAIALRGLQDRLLALEGTVVGLESPPTLQLPPSDVNLDGAVRIQVSGEYDNATLLGMLFMQNLKTDHAFARKRAAAQPSNEWWRALIDKMRIQVAEDEKAPLGRELGLVGEIPIQAVPYRAIDPTAYDPYHARVPYLRADEAMKTDFTNYGLEMIPTLLASVAYHYFRLKSVVFGLFTTFDMPSNPFNWPKFTSGPTVRRVLELSDRIQLNIASGTIPDSKPATDAVAFSAGKIGALTVYSEELLMGSSVPMAEALALEFISAMAKGADYVALNGDEDASATNISNLGTDPTGTDYDRVLVADGLRDMALANSDSVAEATWAKTTPGVLAQMMGPRGIIGRDIRNLFMVADPGSCYKADALDAYESLADVGPQATLLTGQVGQVKGIPLLCSEEIELGDADGKYEDTHAAGTKGSTVMAHRDIIRIGRRRAQMLETESRRFSDGWAIWSTIMFDIQQMEAGGAAYVFNTTV